MIIPITITTSITKDRNINEENIMTAKRKNSNRGHRMVAPTKRIVTVLTKEAH